MKIPAIGQYAAADTNREKEGLTSLATAFWWTLVAAGWTIANSSINRQELGPNWTPFEAKAAPQATDHAYGWKNKVFKAQGRLFCCPLGFGSSLIDTRSIASFNKEVD